MIKWIALILLTLGLGACSSGAKKQKDAEKQTTEAAAESAKEAEEAKTESSANTAGSILCELKNDKRNIQVQAKDSGCEVVYSKFGKEEVVATSASGTAHCEKITERIQTNLKEAGFECSN